MGLRSYIQQALQSTVYYGSNANRSITPPIAARGDRFFNYTSLLLDGDGINGLQNNTFLDSSTNNFTITRSGNTTQGSFSPFGDNWSNYFDGSGDYLELADSDDFNFGSGDFTIEFFVNPSSTSRQTLFTQIDSAGQNTSSSFYTEINSSAQWRFLVASGSTSYEIVAGSAITNKWTHLAYVRNGNTTTLYVDGVSIGTRDVTGVTINNSSEVVSIGRYPGGLNFTGFISNLHVVKGTALYTSNFTPPTSPLTAVTNTVLLTCQSNSFKDNSTNNFTITRTGDVSVQKFGPFAPTTAYSSSVIGGSGYFDGTGDYLGNTSSALIGPSINTFTVESWIYMTANPTFNAIEISGLIGLDAQPANTTNYLSFGPISSRQLRLYWYDGAQKTATGSTALNLNQWYHVACVINSNTIKFYVNGIEETLSGTTTLTNRSGTISNFSIGSNYYGAFSGYVSNLRVTTTAVYTSNFTPPTAPLTAVTNTELLLNFTNGGIIDSTGLNNLETVGNAQISTTQSKFGGSSLYFDGTGDQLLGTTSPNLIFGTGDFTIEAWIYQTQRNTLSDIVSCHNYGVAADWLWSLNTYGNLYFQIGSSGTGSQLSSSSVPLNTWTHVAVTRSNGTVKQFINGTETSSATYSTSISNTIRLSVGSAANLNAASTFYGYLDDLRITKGIARYTANFTPPTKEFASIFGSDPEDSAILATGGTIVDDGGYRMHFFTSPGSFVVSDAGPGTVEYLVVAGGGGSSHGGGGAGGFRTGTNFPVTSTTYPITVGGGGPGVPSRPSPGTQGNPSIFSTITSTGGGFGGANNAGGVGSPGGNGGSGGGAGYQGATGGTGNSPPVSPPQGNNGGPSSPTGSGGGGGAGGTGGTGSSPGGVGGIGSPITWVPASYGTPGPAPGRYFAGGGGAGAVGVPGGVGGAGGGGTGGPPAGAGTPGTTNTGGGGGGGGIDAPGSTFGPGGSGGSGIVIIRYPI